MGPQGMGGGPAGWGPPGGHLAAHMAPHARMQRIIPPGPPPQGHGFPFPFPGPYGEGAVLTAVHLFSSVCNCHACMPGRCPGLLRGPLAVTVRPRCVTALLSSTANPSSHLALVCSTALPSLPPLLLLQSRASRLHQLPPPTATDLHPLHPNLPAGLPHHLMPQQLPHPLAPLPAPPIGPPFFPSLQLTPQQMAAAASAAEAAAVAAVAGQHAAALQQQQQKHLGGGKPGEGVRLPASQLPGNPNQLPPGFASHPNHLLMSQLLQAYAMTQVCVRARARVLMRARVCGCVCEGGGERERMCGNWLGVRRYV